MQSRIESAIESFVNIAIGYFVAIISQMVVFPIFDIHVSMQTNLLIGAWFTCISLVRSYVVRRLFNMRTRNKSMPAPAATSERRRQADGNTARGRRLSMGGMKTRLEVCTPWPGSLPRKPEISTGHPTKFF